MHTSLVIVFCCLAAVVYCVPREYVQKSGKTIVRADHHGTVSATPKRICYYSNWSQYRPNRPTKNNQMYDGKFVPESIDASLCSHVIFAFAYTDDQHKLVPYEWNDEQMWGRFIQVRNNANNGIKMMIAVAGWNYGTERMTALLQTAATRKAFIDSCISLLRQYDFDGMDLDFEYPGSRGSPAEDKFLFTLLIQEFRQAIENDAVSTGKPKLLLSAAVGAGKATIDAGYEIDKICSELDWIGIMTYDFNGAWDNITGHNAPLYARTDDPNALFNVEYAANYWAQSCTKDKLVVGIPTYGRAFTLTDASNNAIGAPAKGAAEPGLWTREAGFYSYYEICDNVLYNGAVYHWHDEHEVPYGYLGETWAGFDGVNAIQNKVNWIRDNGFSGWMVWDLDLDDFLGTMCNQGKYPLITTANCAWSGTCVGFTTTTSAPGVSTTTTTTQATTTTSSSGGDVCADGNGDFHPHPGNCRNYIRCANGISYVQECAPSLVFNPSVNNCDFMSNVSQEDLCWPEVCVGAICTNDEPGKK